MIEAGGSFGLIATVCATVSAAVSACAAIASLRAIRASHRASQGSVLARLMADHASAEMAAGIENLSKHKELLEQRTVGTWQPEADPPLHEFLIDGRRLTSFFLQVDTLRRHGVLSDLLFREIILHWGGFHVWSESWMPFIIRSVSDGSYRASTAWAASLIARFPTEHSS
jgi:hypothetical protein